MKCTLSWLQDYLETDASVEEIGARLTALGLEIEEVIDHSTDLAPFRIAHILEAEQHPDADKLRVCQVDAGAETLQIVCGAPNARAGIKVVLAPVGSIIPTNQLKIKASAIRGVESNGMMCSASELGIGEDSAGIIELPEDAPVGEPYLSLPGVNDPVFDIAITPNRGDCLGVYGLARDLAASGLGTLKSLEVPSIAGNYASPINVHAEDQTQCPLFIGRHFRAVKNGPSPAWLQQRLQAIGLSPVSALVDITNYIAYSFGRPLHVYDADTLKGDLTVRSAKEKEPFRALNGKDYSCEAGFAVVADEQSVHALAGVMGGEASSCTLETDNVFLEVALFDPEAVAKAGRALQLDSDSRYRFERHVDPAFAEKGMQIATQMILDICGGETSEPVSTAQAPLEERTITFLIDCVKTLGGMAIDRPEIITILKALGFDVKEESGSELQLIVPTWRHDVEGPADIVEELLRIKGYDNLEATPLPVTFRRAPAFSASQKRVRNLRRMLVARGVTEAISFSFTSQKKAEPFLQGQKPLLLANPISADLDTMQPSLLPHLLDAVSKNAARQFHDLQLFSIGPVFSDTTKDGQKQVLSVVRAGQFSPRSLYGNQRAVDVYDAKADALAIIESCGMQADRVSVTTDAPSWYHPGRSGTLRVGGKQIYGYFGELHPSLCRLFDVKGSIVICELWLDAIPYPRSKKGKKPALSVSDFQSSKRDFAFIVNASVPANDVVQAVKGVDKQLIQDVSLFDVYQGKNMEEGKKSIALSVTLQSMKGTLTDEEIDGVSEKVIQAVSKRTGAVLRQA